MSAAKPSCSAFLMASDRIDPAGTFLPAPEPQMPGLPNRDDRDRCAANLSCRRPHCGARKPARAAAMFRTSGTLAPAEYGSNYLSPMGAPGGDRSSMPTRQRGRWSILLTREFDGIIAVRCTGNALVGTRPLRRQTMPTVVLVYLTTGLAVRTFDPHIYLSDHTIEVGREGPRPSTKGARHV
jgi:hypothetical protein